MASCLVFAASNLVDSARFLNFPKSLSIKYIMKQLNKATSSMLGFIPAIVVQHILDKKSRGSPLVVPEKQSFRSVVMFADISGFTNLTEQLS